MGIAILDVKEKEKHFCVVFHMGEHLIQTIFVGISMIAGINSPSRNLLAY